MNAATKNATVPVEDLEALLEAWRRSAAHERQVADSLDPERYPESHAAAVAGTLALDDCISHLAAVIQAAS